MEKYLSEPRSNERESPSEAHESSTVNIRAVLVWFRLYAVEGHPGIFNKAHLKQMLDNAKAELKTLEGVR